MNKVLPELLLALLTASLTYFFARKKNRTDIKKMEAETHLVEKEVEEAGVNNIRNLISIYKEISDDLKKELQQVHKECLLLKEEVQALRTENLVLKKQIHDLNRIMTKKEKTS